MHPHTPRPIRFLELFRPPGWSIKVYGITHAAELPDPALVTAAKSWAAHLLATVPTRHTTYGVGFLGVHDGRGMNQVFLDCWIDENELLHHIAVSPKHTPAALADPGPDHNSVCIWDLALQWHERQAWIEEVLTGTHRPEPDRLAAYTRRTWSGEA